MKRCGRRRSAVQFQRYAAILFWATAALLQNRFTQRMRRGSICVEFYAPASVFTPLAKPRRDFARADESATRGVFPPGAPPTSPSTTSLRHQRDVGFLIVKKTQKTLVDARPATPHLRHGELARAHGVALEGVLRERARRRDH